MVTLPQRSRQPRTVDSFRKGGIVATPSTETIVIVAYKPKPAKEAELLQLTHEHDPLLRAEVLATDHPVIACQAKDGTIVEVFE
jgi:hypothetical protein